MDTRGTLNLTGIDIAIASHIVYSSREGNGVEDKAEYAFDLVVFFSISASL